VTDASDWDFTGIGGFSIAAGVLFYAFRTIWRQEAGWKSLINEERESRDEARHDAAEARTNAASAQAAAAEAHIAASAARLEAREARLATTKCEEEHEQTRLALAGAQAKLERIVQHLDRLGIPLPD